MTSSPRVAVVIPCYRQAEFLPATVASVCAQTYEDLEIIVVDDGSPDDTAEVTQRLIAAHPGRRIRLLRQSNQGLSATRNNGIAATAAEYILPLDADDLLSPGFVEDCVAALDARPEVSIAYGSLRYFGDIDEFHVPSAYDFVRLTTGNLFPCTALFRRRAWEDAGGYDEALTSFEDWDFWLSCGELGHLGVLVPRPVFYYRKRPGSMLVGARARARRLRAQIVLNHPGLYSAEQAGWARAVLAGPTAPVGEDLPAAIPALGDPPVRAARSGGSLTGARRFAMLAVAGELLEHPELLSAFASAYRGGDDATLVICGSAGELERLGVLVEELGLDSGDAADLLGIVLDGPAGLAWAATKVDAVLTRRVIRLPVALPRFDDLRLASLRPLAAAA